jgi:mono/diheme cytochrome c family protein
MYSPSKRLGFAAAAAAAASVLLVWGCTDNNGSANQGGLPGSTATQDQIVHGRYIVTTQGDCAGCHNRGDDNPNDPNWLAGYIQSPTLNPGDNGKFQVGPFTVLAANITPDTATGIGNWTPQDIFNALRNGHDPAGHVLCPPMPWPTFRNMTDSDLWSIVAYLKSIKPVSNAVPAPTGPGVPAGQEADCSIFYTHLEPLPPFPAANETQTTVSRQAGHSTK